MRFSLVQEKDLSIMGLIWVSLKFHEGQRCLVMSKQFQFVFYFLEDARESPRYSTSSGQEGLLHVHVDQIIV